MRSSFSSSRRFLLWTFFASASRSCLLRKPDRPGLKRRKLNISENDCRLLGDLCPRSIVTLSLRSAWLPRFFGSGVSSLSAYSGDDWFSGPEEKSGLVDSLMPKNCGAFIVGVCGSGAAGILPLRVGDDRFGGLEEMGLTIDSLVSLNLCACK